MKPIWYGGDDYGSAEATGHGARQSDAAQSGPQVVWTLSGYAGVRGFFEVADFGRASGGRERLLDWLEHDYKIDQQVQRLAADAAAMGESASSVYHQDYRHLPYKLRNGEMQVLSRWNMAQQKLTVSRVQCAVRVAASGAATLTSCGKGPTLWRAWGGPWNALHREERRVLSDGDQLSLDWQEPEAAIFTCQVEGAAQQPYEGHAWQQGQHAQRGAAFGLPEGWVADVDQASGDTYYYNEYTGLSQWEPPQYR